MQGAAIFFLYFVKGSDLSLQPVDQQRSQLQWDIIQLWYFVVKSLCNSQENWVD